jgi:hypothetical protein
VVAAAILLPALLASLQLPGASSQKPCPAGCEEYGNCNLETGVCECVPGLIGSKPPGFRAQGFGTYVCPVGAGFRLTGAALCAGDPVPMELARPERRNLSHNLYCVL